MALAAFVMDGARLVGGEEDERGGHVRAWGVPIGRGLLGQWQDVVVCTVVCDVVCVG